MTEKSFQFQITSQFLYLAAPLLHFLFVQVLLTLTHLAIVMEYAAEGELFERICNAGRFSEDEVYFINIF